MLLMEALTLSRGGGGGGDGGGGVGGGRLVAHSSKPVPVTVWSETNLNVVYPCTVSESGKAAVLQSSPQ